MAVSYFAGTDLTLSMTVTDENGNAVNLTGATLTLKMVDPSGFQRTLAPTITNATAGDCSMALTSAQLALAGAYSFQLVVTNSGAVTATNIFSLTLDSQLF